MSKINSAVVIARLLDTEGFSDYTANQVERYWLKNSGLSASQLSKIKKLGRAVSEMAASMSIGDRLVLGRFIGLHKKMSFDTGLRVGLTAYAVKTAKDVEEVYGTDQNTAQA